MATLAPYLDRLVTEISRRTPRERWLIAISAAAALALILMQLLAPLFAERAHLKKVLQTREAEVQTLQRQVAELVRAQGEDPDAPLRERIAALTAALGGAGDVAGALHGMVAPRDMVGMVEGVLRQNRSLELVAIRNLVPEPQPPATPVSPPGPDPAATVPATDPAAPAAGAPGVSVAAPLYYRHALRIELKGRYPDMVRYLRALEALPWKVLWGELGLRVENHPVSRLTLLVYTFNRGEGWIGI